MKPEGYIGLVIVIVILLAEYYACRKIVVSSILLKLAAAVVLPLIIMVAVAVISSSLYIVGLVGVTCVLSIPTLLVAIRYHKKGSDCDIVINLGDTMSFSGKVYGSVGLTYKVVFDKDAFVEKVAARYLYEPKPSDYHKDEKTGEMVFCRPCGGDEQEVVHNLTAIKKGIYEVEEISEFRGGVDSVKKHRVYVES